MRTKRILCSLAVAAVLLGLVYAVGAQTHGTLSYRGSDY